VIVWIYEGAHTKREKSGGRITVSKWKYLASAALLLFFANPAHSQDECDELYSYVVQAPGYNSSGTQEHQPNGSHQFAASQQGECDYSGNTNRDYCLISDSAVPGGSTNDIGVVNPYPLGCHVAGIGTKAGAANGQKTPITATSVTVGGVSSCLSCYCSPVTVSVSYPPVSFSFSPKADLWADQQTYNNTCDPQILCVPQSCPLRYQWNQQTCQCEYVGGSPILIDTRNAGFHLSNPDDCVMFDLKGDGAKQCYSWPEAGSGNGWLALDRNHNGKIDDGKELFGNYTPQTIPINKRSHKEMTGLLNGYRALREFKQQQNGGHLNEDGSIDLVIDERDAVYKDLLVWIDDNRDGISQPNELHHLDELGIRSLSLAFKASRKEDKWGNTFRLTAPMTMNDGKPYDNRTYDVWLVQGKGSK